jgi:hypothetical protein
MQGIKDWNRQKGTSRGLVDGSTELLMVVDAVGVVFVTVLSLRDLHFFRTYWFMLD